MIVLGIILGFYSLIGAGVFAHHMGTDAGWAGSLWRGIFWIFLVPGLIWELLGAFLELLGEILSGLSN